MARQSSLYVATPEQFPTYLPQAFRSAMSGTPRPVHLDLEGLAGENVIDQEGDLEVIIEEWFSQLPPFRLEAEKEKINAALEMLAQAKRPIIDAGGGAVDVKTNLEGIAPQPSNLAPWSLPPSGLAGRKNGSVNGPRLMTWSPRAMKMLKLYRQPVISELTMSSTPLIHAVGLWPVCGVFPPPLNVLVKNDRISTHGKEKRRSPRFYY